MGEAEQATSRSGRGKAGSGQGKAGIVIGLIAVLLALALGVWSFQRFNQIESELTRRLHAADQQSAGFAATLKQSQNLLRGLQNRSAVLESKVAESAGLQAQLEKLYRDRAQDSIEALLAEVEGALTLGGQQLALGASPQSVLPALQDLDSRLARENDPRLAPVRAALAGDIERLRAYPATDVGTLAMRIDALIGAIDQLPLLSAVNDAAEGSGGVVETPGPGSKPQAAPGLGSQAEPGAGSRSQTAPATAEAPGIRARLDAGLEAIGSELRGLFRVRRVDSPDALLVSPQQSYFLRQNLRLTLLDARLALLSRNDEVYRSDLERARRWIDKYYDTEHRNVIAVQAQLRQLLDTKLLLEPPRLDASLAAVRAARSAVR